MVSKINLPIYRQSRALVVGVWILRVLLGGAFIFFSLMKLSGRPGMVAEFNTVGLGQWFRYFTGALELTGGVAVLIPRVSVFGAIVLLLVDIGAFVAQVTVLHVDWIHAIVIGALLALLIYFQRQSLATR
jgi:putative oxidoreductase